MSARVVVLGGGAWGTALAIHLATRSTVRADVTLYMRDPAAVAATLANRENRRYLPQVAIPANLAVTSTLDGRSADVVFVATPTASLGDVRAMLARTRLRAPILTLSKGFVPAPDHAQGFVLPHQALAPGWPHAVGSVSGPTFAVEVAQGLPTALVVASLDDAVTRDVASLLRCDNLRAYKSGDLVGVELGGAVKNVFAIAAGASDGLGFGDNARAALVTRALAESARLSHALGGTHETLMGLAGLGDLVLTCTGNLSRNRRVGLALSRGQALDGIVAELGHVAEGIPGARAVRSVALHHGVDMPIVDAVYRVLYERMPLRDAVLSLLSREPGAE
ncbi:MAG TPA: NAD(P)H-dependent glycerol-3-phosphate dehydrogenase [Casimicrobiaceae bacterium]